MSKYKIEAVGVDTTHADLPSIVPGDIDFIYTEITACNDTELSPLQPHPKLIVGVSFAGEHMLSALELHLAALGRTKVDILLFDGVQPRLREINILKSVVDEFAIRVRYEDINNLPENMDLYRYVALDISPLNFPYSLIKWAEGLGKNIIGFNPMGGSNESSTISTFSAPYLLSFISTYSSIVIISGRQAKFVEDNRRYLLSLIDKEHPEEFNSLTKDTAKGPKRQKGAFYTSFKFGPGLVVPYDDPTFTTADHTEIVVSLNKPEEVCNIYKDYSVGIIKDSNEYLGILDVPGTENLDARFAMSRLYLLDWLDKRYKDWDTRHTLTVGKRIMFVSFETGVEVSTPFWSPKKTKEVKEESYVLVMMSNGDLHFLSLANIIEDQNVPEKLSPAERVMRNLAVDMA